MKRIIYPLYAPADESKVKPVLTALQELDVAVRDSHAPAAKDDALVLFLSSNLTEDSPEEDAFFRLNAGRELVIPVNLDGCTPPQELQNVLMARHALDGRKYAPRELAKLIERAARKEGGSPLPAILTAAAVLILLLVGGFVLWNHLPPFRPGPSPSAAAAESTPTAIPTPSPTPTPHVDGIELDLTLVAEVVYVGDTFQYYNIHDGYHKGARSVDEARTYHEIAYDADGYNAFYNKETGQQIPMGELGDVSYLKYLPNLMHLTFVNVKGQLPDLSDLGNLYTVTIINCDIPDVLGLAGSSIRRFEYHGAAVKDFSPLNDCANLNDVAIAPWSDPAGVDMSGFHPPKLRQLAVSGKVENLDGISQCPNLKNLSLQDAYLTDLNCLKGLQLTDLRMNQMPRLASIEGLRGMTALEYLNLSDIDRLATLDGLQGMDTLKELRIHSCPRLRDISALEGCSSLGVVDISSGNNGWYDDLTDASVLGTLPRLQNIGLYGVNIRDLDFLKELRIKKNINLGFCIAQGADLSGLDAVDTYNYLHVNAHGSYAAAAPYLMEKTVRQLMIYSGGLVDLSTLPQVTGELDLCHCLNRDLTGIREMNFGGKLLIQDCLNFSSFTGIENLTGIGKAGSTLAVENCPRLTDWSGIEGKSFHRVEFKGVFTLPDLTRFTFSELALEYLDEDTLPDLSCLEEIDKTRFYSFRFVGMDQIVDLSPLFRLKGNALEVPPQVGEQARGLVEDKRFKSCEIVYPDGGWDPSDVQVLLTSLDELDTLPPSLLKHVKQLTIVGDELVNDETTNYWAEWGERNVPAFVEDRATGEQKRIDKAGTLFQDLSRLSALTGLEKLTLWWQPLTSLEGIEVLDDLKYLKVMFCPKLTDVSAAFTLQGLREINFERCPVTSLQGIQNLYNLEELEVCNTKITSIEGVEGLKHLARVRIAGTNVKDLSPLGQADYTWAAENRGGVGLALNVSDSRRLSKDAFAFLEGVPCFTQLELNNVPVAMWMDHLAGKPVKWLGADDCGFTDESFQAFVEAHPELEYISVSYNQKIKDASILLGLENLREVRLSRDMKDAIASLGEGYRFELQLD